MMEKLPSGLELAALSKENIRRTLDGLQDRASSILLFTLQWKELESFLDQRLQELKSREERLFLLEDAAQRSAGEVEVRGREVEERFKMIVAREEEFNLQQKIESEKRSHEMESIRRSSEDLDSFAELVDDKLKCIERKQDELVLMGDRNEKQLGELKLMESFVREKLEEIKRREEEFGAKEQRCFRDLQLKRKQHEDGIAGNKVREGQLEILSQELRRQYQLKDRNIQEKENKLEDSFKDLVAREKELAIKQRLEAEILRKRYELEYETIQEKEKKTEDCFKEIAAREKEFDVKQILETERRQADLESSRKLMLLGKSIEEKMKQLDVTESKLLCMGRSTEKQLAELKLLETFVKDRLNVIKQKEQEFGLKEKHLRQCSEDLELEGKRHEECRSGLEQKEKCLGELFQELCRQQELLDHNVRDLELRERKLELSKQHQLQESIEMVPLVKTEAVHSADADIRFYVTMDGKNLQIFLNERCNEHSSLAGEIAIVLQQSSDPAKLVLDAMEGFYPPFLRKEDQTFEADVARRSCIMLLDQLRVISPQIKPHVKQQALKLAFAWITKVRADVTDPLKVLGFLQLLASYKLASSFHADEICNLLLNVAGHHQMHRIVHSLGFVNKISAFIQNLVEGKQYLKAINFIFAFELVNEFAPVRLLGQYLARSKCEARTIYRKGNKTLAAKILADTKRISHLKAIVKCVEEYKLESRYSPVKLKNHKVFIAALEKRVSDNKAKLNNLEQNAYSKPCGQNKDSKGSMGGIKQNVNGKLDDMKQTQNMKQTLKNAASTPLSGSVKSEKSIVKKRPFAAMSDGTAGNNSVAGSATSFINKVPSTSPGLGDSLEGYIQQLIEEDRILEAVKYIFQSHMTDKFHPVPLLINHLESRKNAFDELLKKDDISIERQITGVNRMIGAIKGVIKCIEVHKLESEFPIGFLQREIADLIKTKAEKRCVLQNSIVKGKPESKLDLKESPRQQEERGCTISATANSATPVMPVAAAPATPAPSAAAPAAVAAAASHKISAPTSRTVASPETNDEAQGAGPHQHDKKSCTSNGTTTTFHKISAPTSRTAAPPETNDATHGAGPHQHDKKSCTSNSTTTTNALVTSATAAPITPIPSAAEPAVAPAAAPSNTAAPPSSTAAPPITSGGTHRPGLQHPNKRPRTSSPEQHYSLSGYPPRNVHPSHWHDGVTPHYSFYVLGGPNLHHQQVHHADTRNSFAQPLYYYWGAPPHGHGY